MSFYFKECHIRSCQDFSDTFKSIIELDFWTAFENSKISGKKEVLIVEVFFVKCNLKILSLHEKHLPDFFRGTAIRQFLNCRRVFGKPQTYLQWIISRPRMQNCRNNDFSSNPNPFFLKTIKTISRISFTSTSVNNSFFAESNLIYHPFTIFETWNNELREKVFFILKER